jgi:CRP-like cAMP-binding protein
MEDGSEVEVATVGREGTTGLPVFLGVSSSPGRAFCQIEGDAWRMSADDLRAASEPGSALYSALQLFTQAMIILISQSAACNRTHVIEQRCARWLLMTHDRVSRDQYYLTQEFLAQMLGVRRAAVNQAAGALQNKGIIEYTRGRMTIKDRAALEGASCECYAIIHNEFERLLPMGDAA